MGKEEKILSQEEKERTKRQKLIEGWDQTTIKNSTVFIAGVGALGCEIAKDLALSGIGRLILCDLDKIETSNLSRQMLFYKGDEGRYKAEVAAERLKLMNPFMETEVFTIPLQKISMEKYMECQVIVAALDNVKARMDLNKFSLKLKIPMVEGGTVGFEGHVQVIIPKNTRSINKDLIKFGNKDKKINDFVTEKIWSLDEKKPENKDYFNGQKKIKEIEEKINLLQEEISNIKKKEIKPYIDKLKEKIENEIEKNPAEYLNHTPCYRCLVPIPPPLQNQVAACTLKGIPRTREHCAIRGEVLFQKNYDRQADYEDLEDMTITLQFAQKELRFLRERVLDESIPPEMKGKISESELKTIQNNIFDTFGGDFALEDMENILGNKIPAIQSVSSIISSIQSQETIKLLFKMKGKDVGHIMDPLYINYNGAYGLFQQIPINKSPDCVACGSGIGQENLNVVVPFDSTVDDLFKAMRQVNASIEKEHWIITNSLSKTFIYNPMFEKGKTGGQKLKEFDIKNMDEVKLTVFGKAKQKNEIKQFNVIVQII